MDKLQTGHRIEKGGRAGERDFHFNGAVDWPLRPVSGGELHRLQEDGLGGGGVGGVLGFFGVLVENVGWLRMLKAQKRKRGFPIAIEKVYAGGVK